MKTELPKQQSELIVIIGLMTAIRELTHCYKEDTSYTNKYILNNSERALNQMFRHFDKTELNQDPSIDIVVDKFINLATDIKEEIEDILENN